MPSLVVPSGGQLRLHWTQGSSQAFNVLGLFLGAGVVADQSLANAMGSAVSSAWTTSTLATHIDSGTSLTGVGVRDLRTEGGVEYMATGFTAKPGAAVGSRSGFSNSLCVTLRTAKAGKKYRGRVYLPLDGAGAIDEETALYNTTAKDSGNNFITMLRQAIASEPLGGGNLTLAVVSRQYLLCTPVTANTVRSAIVTTQRRRLPKRG